MGTCRAIRKDGQNCTARALADGSGLCWAHNPALQDKRDRARRAGGQGKTTAARLTKLVPASLKPTLDLLLTALTETHEGSLEPRQASAIASLAGAISRIYETASLEQRLSHLEESLVSTKLG